MARYKKKNQSKLSLNLIITIGLAPLFLLKWIGNLIIFFGSFFSSNIINSYKLISKIFDKAKSINLLFKYRKKAVKFRQKKPKIRFSNLYRIWQSLWRTKPSKVKKEKIIYRKCPRWIDQIKKTARRIRSKIFILKQKIFSIPKRIYYYLYFNLVFIKIKYFLAGALLVGAIFTFYQCNNFLENLPNPNFLTQQDSPTTTKIYDRNGNLLYEIYEEQNRTPIKISDVPKFVKDATIAIEDSDFYNHKGYSPKGIIRATIHNLTQDTLEGGSTITQQLIRSALLTPEKTLKRKIEEVLLAAWAEKIYSKEQILEMYFNQVPYGGTAWGIEAASQTYFGKSVKELTLSEAAILAGLPAAPSRYSPFGMHPELTKQRQEEVLDRMAYLGYIAQEEVEKVKSEPLRFKTPRVAITAPHFVMYVKNLLEQFYGPKIVANGGLRVTTSLDLSIQQIAQEAVTEQVENLRSLLVGNGAALVTNPQTGEILAMVGSSDYFDNERHGNVNVTLSLRQPGSSIKVVNYAAALKLGFTATSLINDTPVIYKAVGQPSYTPVNYDGRYHGTVTLRRALASSYNIPAVKILDRIGVKTMIEQGRLMGITSWNDEARFGLSLTLGGGEVTMLDMAKVYGTLADNGIRRELNPFLKITNYKGETLSIPISNNTVKAVTPEIAFIISNILSDNNARTPAFGPNSSLVIPGKTVSVKTGTSDNKRDNWTIGYTPDYLASVWVGNNDNTPMNPQLTSGVTGATPIWNEIMSKLLADKLDKTFTVPNGIVMMPCYGKLEYFVRGTEPKGGCPIIKLTPSASIVPTQNSNR